MSYRIKDHPRPRPQRSVVDIATPIKVFAHNGTTEYIAFPCWYQEIHRPIRAHHHDHHWHDHVGWPAPDHPDHCCQLWAPDRHCCSLGKHHECSPHCKHYIDYSNVSPRFTCSPSTKVTRELRSPGRRTTGWHQPALRPPHPSIPRKTGWSGSTSTSTMVRRSRNLRSTSSPCS